RRSSDLVLQPGVELPRLDLLPRLPPLGAPPLDLGGRQPGDLLLEGVPELQLVVAPAQALALLRGGPLAAGGAGEEQEGEGERAHGGTGTTRAGWAPRAARRGRARSRPGAVDRAQVHRLAAERQLLVGELVREDGVAALKRPAAADRARQVQAERVSVLLVDRHEGAGLL